MISRSHLYVPANDLGRLEKALDRGADALIVDLEDGVSLADKDLARKNLALFLSSLNSTVEIWVRVNSGELALRSDLEAAVHTNTHGIVLAKANSLNEVKNLDLLIPEL